MAMTSYNCDDKSHNCDDKSCNCSVHAIIPVTTKVIPDMCCHNSANHSSTLMTLFRQRADYSNELLGVFRLSVLTITVTLYHRGWSVLSQVEYYWLCPTEADNHKAKSTLSTCAIEAEQCKAKSTLSAIVPQRLTSTKPCQLMVTMHHRGWPA